MNSKVPSKTLPKKAKDELRAEIPPTPPAPVVPFNEVKFIMTKRLVSFIQLVNLNKEFLSEAQTQLFLHTYLPFGHIDSSPLPKSYLLDLLSMYKDILDSNKALTLPDEFDKTEAKSLGIINLIKGSKIAPLAVLQTTYSPAFSKYLGEVRAQQDRLEYRGMTGDLPMYKETTSRTFGMAIQGTTKDLTIAANVILIMLTGFIVFWYAGSMIWPHNKVNQLATGIVGIVGALILETLVLMLNYRKEDIYYEKQQARKLRSLN